ncbi:MAG: ribonuclease III [Lachnospiraceae bacterium]|nr:ribonuclease III [Lachnospiraceae bacterium]
MEKKLETLPEIIRNAYDYKEQSPDALSPLTLAFIGDTIYDLIIRTKVISHGNAPVNKLHRTASAVVNATSQAALIRNITPHLTDEELAIFKRGRNAKSHTTAKNASSTDYKAATGLEALVGWLYLKGRMDRVLELILPELEK